MAKLTKVQLDRAGFAAFQASLAYQRAHLGRQGFMSEEAYWDGNNDVRLHWRSVAQAVLDHTPAGLQALAEGDKANG